MIFEPIGENPMNNDTLVIVKLAMQLGRAMSLLEQMSDAMKTSGAISDETYLLAVDAIGGWHRFMYETNFPEESDGNRADKDG